MSYYIAKIVGRPFDAVVDDITARLKDHGFGVLTDIDVQATLKKKIGADVVFMNNSPAYGDKYCGSRRRPDRRVRCAARVS